MKSKTNKTFSVLIVLTIVFSILVPVISFASYEEVQGGKLAISSATGTVGQEVTIKVTTKEQTTITNMDSLIKYDRTKLQVTNVKEGSVAGTMLVANDRYNHPAGPDGVVVGVVSVGDPVTVPAGTELATITFKILDGADKTNTLTYVYDNDAQSVLATGTITVDKSATNVTLDKTALMLTTTGETKTGTLTATISPEDTTDQISWSSSNTAVATVNGNGKDATVTAVGDGTAVVTVKVGSKSASCNVSVSTPLTGIKLSDAPAEVIKGKTFDLKVTPEPSNAIIPDGAVTWEIEPTDVATVENGKVTALKEGTATVTAKVGEFTDSKTFNVKEIPLESIAINKDDFELFLGDTQQLSIIINPENTTDDVSKVEWKSDSDAVTVDENGVVRATKIGEANITATVNGKTATVKITVPEVKLEGIQAKSNKTQLKMEETASVWFETTPSRHTDNLIEMKILYL